MSCTAGANMLTQTNRIQCYNTHQQTESETDTSHFVLRVSLRSQSAIISYTHPPIGIKRFIEASMLTPSSTDCRCRCWATEKPHRAQRDAMLYATRTHHQTLIQNDAAASAVPAAAAANAISKQTMLSRRLGARAFSHTRTHKKRT